MAVNKVKLSNGETLIDISGDTVTPETLAKGITAHSANGEKIEGTCMPLMVDSENWTTDLIKNSIDVDGSIYNGVGYKIGYRLNSAGQEVELANSAITGFIPFSIDDILKVEGTRGKMNNMRYVWAYDENFKPISALIGLGGSRYGWAKFNGGRTKYLYDYSNDITSKVKYIRLSLDEFSSYPVAAYKAEQKEAVDSPEVITNAKTYEITLAKASGWVLLTTLDDEVAEHINDDCLVVSLVRTSEYIYEWYAGNIFIVANMAQGKQGEYPYYGLSHRQQSETSASYGQIFYPANYTGTSTSLGGYASFRIADGKYYMNPGDGFIAPGTYRLTFTW